MGNVFFLLDGSKEAAYKIPLHHPWEIEEVCGVKDDLCRANDN